MLTSKSLSRLCNPNASSYSDFFSQPCCRSEKAQDEFELNL
jgi:hypothetical protein